MQTSLIHVRRLATLLWENGRVASVLLLLCRHIKGAKCGPLTLTFLSFPLDPCIAGVKWGARWLSCTVLRKTYEGAWPLILRRLELCFHAKIWRKLIALYLFGVILATFTRNCSQILAPDSMATRSCCWRGIFTLLYAILAFSATTSSTVTKVKLFAIVKTSVQESGFPENWRMVGIRCHLVRNWPEIQLVWPINFIVLILRPYLVICDFRIKHLLGA